MKITKTACITLILGCLAAAGRDCPCARASGAESDVPVTDPAFEFVAESGDIREYRLKSNGLGVLLAEDPSAPVATVMITYRAGSACEPEGRRGMAHLVEHMMFKGTPRYNAQTGTGIAAVLQEAGAQMNAMTGPDTTSYYEILPSDRLDLALDIEADRMRGALMRPEDFSKEAGVVLNELERNEDSPPTALYQAVWKEAFGEHPYRHPVIGYREDVGNLTAEELRRFYGRFWRPDNAVLTVIGDFELDKLLAVLAEKFGKISVPAETAAAPLVREPPQNGPRRVTVTKDDDVRLVLLAHKTPPPLDPDAVPLDVLSQILSGGQTSRLYRRLVDPGWAASVETSASKLRDPGLFLCFASLPPGRRHEDIEAAILQVYAGIAGKGVDPDELDKAKAQLRARLAFARDGSYAMASQLSEAIGTGDWRYYENYGEKLAAVTAEDVRRVAKEYLVPDGLTAGYFIPKKSVQDTGQQPVPEESAPAAPDAPAIPGRDAAGQQTGAQASPPGPDFARRPVAERVRSKRIAGIRVITLRTNARDIVTISGSFEGGGTAWSENPVLARLTAEMIDKQTRGRKKFEIAGILERRGAGVSYDAGTERVRFQAACLAGDAAAVIGLAAEQLRGPAFDPGEFEKSKQRETVRLRYASSDTFSQGLAALSRLVYPPGHPEYEIPFEEQIELLEPLKVRDAEEFYRAHYGPRDMVLIAVGDVNAEAVEKAVRQGFGGWKKPRLKRHFQYRIRKSAEPARQTVDVPGKTNWDVFWGQGLPLTRNDGDFLKLYLANHILGGNFSARLNQAVRDRQGLSYSVHSALSGAGRRAEGQWVVHVMLNPPVLERGMAAVTEQLRLFADRGVTADELERKKSTIKGNFKVSFSSTGGFASQLLQNEELDRGPDYLDRYPGLVDAQTLGEVNGAVRRYFHPDRLQIVRAGSSAPGQDPAQTAQNPAVPSGD